MTILERAATLRRHYQEGCAYATTVELRRMLVLLVEAKQESLTQSRINKFATEISRYRTLVD